MSMIFTPDSLRSQVEASSGGHLTVLYDDKGYPSIMRVIPRFRYEDLGFDSELGTGTATAFIVDGVEKSEIFVGQFLASMHDSRAMSLPGRDPRASINWDDAREACEAKGPGWHLFTMHEWAAIALWCKANGFEPRGNTDNGRHHDYTHEVGLRPDGEPIGSTSGSRRTATGSGPASWRHDGGVSGIADLVGNVWEWMSLMRLEDGEVYATEDNHFTQDDSDWPAQGIELPDVSSSTWNNQTTEGNQLTDRLLITHAGVDLTGSLWTTVEGSRFPRRGGSFYYGSRAGLAALYLSSSRSSTHSSIGFRPAFVS